MDLVGYFYKLPVQGWVTDHKVWRLDNCESESLHDIQSTAGLCDNKVRRMLDWELYGLPEHEPDKLVDHEPGGLHNHRPDGQYELGTEAEYDLELALQL